MTVLVVLTATSVARTAMIGCSVVPLVQLAFLVAECMVSLEDGCMGCCLVQLKPGCFCVQMSTLGFGLVLILVAAVGLDQLLQMLTLAVVIG